MAPPRSRPCRARGARLGVVFFVIGTGSNPVTHAGRHEHTHTHAHTHTHTHTHKTFPLFVFRDVARTAVRRLNFTGRWRDDPELLQPRPSLVPEWFGTVMARFPAIDSLNMASVPFALLPDGKDLFETVLPLNLRKLKLGAFGTWHGVGVGVV